MTQDNKKLLHFLTKNKNFNIKVSEPFNKLVIDFLNDFSNKLRKNKKIQLYPNLLYLMFWCSKKKFENLSKNYLGKNIKLGRGLVFHVCPSNVPTNFIYSFFFGILSGNSNIVKIPSKDFEEKKIIISTLNFLFKNKKYSKIKNSNCFIQYKDNNETTKKISAVCDGRVLWGGDQTINEIRKFWIPERSIEITFPDRYSLSIINLKELKKLSFNEIKLLAKKFYYDGYSMNQLACNSPHFIFWIGKKNEKLQNYFWEEVSKFAKKNFIFDDIHVVDKYSNLIENIINQNEFKGLKTFKNFLYVINPSSKTNKIENIRGINGTFFQKNINEIKKLKKYITKKCQTISYFGFDNVYLKTFLLNNNLLGVDRVVPIGKALEIDIIWDGYDVINSLSRTISLE